MDSSSKWWNAFHPTKLGDGRDRRIPDKGTAKDLFECLGTILYGKLFLKGFYKVING